MVQEKKVEFLVVDTSAFIKNAPLQDIGVNIITEENVLSEITNKRQLKRLVVLPYDLGVKQAFPEDIKVVSDFAKKTGDYTSLSATDIKVMALTYRLHIENIGKDTLKFEPVTPKIGDIKEQFQNYPPNLAGFYCPKIDQKVDSEKPEEQKLKSSEEKIQQMLDEMELDSTELENQNTTEPVENNQFDCGSDSQNTEKLTKLTDDDLAEKFANLECDPSDLVGDCLKEDADNILVPVEEKDNEEESSCEDDSEDDDEGWITPHNINKVKKEMESDVVEDEPASVACLTMDFAMQNVLKQMGLHVVTLDGKVIKQLRTFVLRCYACFKTTSVMTKLFCPSCGMKTLKKVSVAVNEKGELQMFINYKKPLSAKGKKFSLPTPKGGKHSNNPILREDQPMPDQRASKLARQKNNPLNDDWIAGYSPFVTRDVTSRSALLGIRPGSEMKYWMRRNPNEVRRKSSKKSK